MTEEQVTKWQARRDEAKRIEDPKAREAALDIVYDMKDDMQLDCQRKMADRIKELIASDRVQASDISVIKTDLASVRTTVDDHDPIVKAVRNAQLRSQGAWLLLKIIGWSVAVFGSGAVGWWMALAKKAAGAE